MILTGDKNLRLEAESSGLEVHGVLWVIKTLVSLTVRGLN